MTATTSALVNLGSKFLTIGINQAVWSRGASMKGVGLLVGMLMTTIFYRQVLLDEGLKMCTSESKCLSTICHQMNNY